MLSLNIILLKFGHILLVAEIIIAVDWAFSSVEKVFGTVNRMSTNTRLRLSRVRFNITNYC